MYTKEELESKFEDCFDDNTRASEGGYGPDVTDKRGLWKSIEPHISEYAQQQAIAFNKWQVKNDFYTNCDSHWFRKDGEGIAASTEELYVQFIEHQKQTENK